MDELLEVLPAVPSRVLDRAAELLWTQALEDHRRLGWREMPVGCPGRSMWILVVGAHMTIGTTHRGRSAAVRPALHEHRVREPRIGLEWRVGGGVAVLAAGALQHARDLEERLRSWLERRGGPRDHYPQGDAGNRKSG